MPYFFVFVENIKSHKRWYRVEAADKNAAEDFCWARATQLDDETQSDKTISALDWDAAPEWAVDLAKETE